MHLGYKKLRFVCTGSSLVAFMSIGVLFQKLGCCPCSLLYQNCLFKTAAAFFLIQFFSVQTTNYPRFLTWTSCGPYFTLTEVCPSFWADFSNADKMSTKDFCLMYFEAMTVCVEYSYYALTSWLLHSSPGCWLQLTNKTISQFPWAQQIQEGLEYGALEYGVVYSFIITTAICWSLYMCWQPQKLPIIIFIGRLHW